MAAPLSAEVKPAPNRKRFERLPDPCGIVVFGASGDLSKRKIIPAIYDLSREGLLPDKSYVVGFARSEMDDKTFRERMFEAVNNFSRHKPVSQAEFDSFAERLSYFRGDYKDPAAFDKLAKYLDSQDSKHHIDGNRLFYLSTPPDVYESVGRLLAASGQASQENGRWIRLVIEKPFGHDLESARDLSAVLKQAWEESQIYRIDHYLGKETVQNILVLRFANGIFEPIWNRQHIDHVQITAAESIGVEERAGYYEEAGALRDMFQNHMMQLVSLVAMEPPSSFDADNVRSEKVKVLKAIHPIPSSQVDRFVVRGQYGPGKVAGQDVPGYREEPGVAPDSKTETYIAARLLIDNWRWADVPFYVRSGKRLGKRASEISIIFRRVPHMMFRSAESISPNVLKLIIQPDEGITLSFEAKSPGQSVHLQSVLMDFRYSQFGAKPIEAYERLLMDCMLGDQTLFDRSDSVEAAWALMQPILDGWAAQPHISFPNYAAGSWGPEESDDLIGVDGHRWRNPGETF